MGELAKRLGIFVVGNLILYGIVCAADKAISKRKERKKKKFDSETTYTDWYGNVVLGTRDYQIV